MSIVKPCITAKLDEFNEPIFQVNPIVINSFACYGLNTADLRWVLANPLAVRLLSSPLPSQELDVPRPTNIIVLLVGYAFFMIALWLLVWVLLNFGYHWSQPATRIVLIVAGVVSLVLTLGFFGYITKKLFRAMYSEKTAIVALRTKINSYNAGENCAYVKKQVEKGSSITLTDEQIISLEKPLPAALTPASAPAAPVAF